MVKSLFKGSILGGIVVYLWFAISWMLIPWHCGTLQEFSNERQVAQILQQNAQKDGIYVIPNLRCGSDTLTAEKKEIVESGPFVFVSLTKKARAFDSYTMYIKAFVIYAVGALLITFMALQTHKLSYWQKVGFITLVGFTVGFLGKLPFWNWWGFSFSFVLIEILDHVIAWLLAGLVIAACIRKKANG
jgi:hypothetical protein